MGGRDRVPPDDLIDALEVHPGGGRCRRAAATTQNRESHLVNLLTGSLPGETTSVLAGAASEFLAQVVMSQQHPHLLGHVVDVLREESADPVHDRFARAAGMSERDRRCAVQSGFDDRQTPTLLVRGHEGKPGTCEEGVLGVLVDEAVEQDAVGNLTCLRVPLEFRAPIAGTDDVQSQVGDLVA